MKDSQDDRSASYAVRDGDSVNDKLPREETGSDWTCGHTLRDHERNDDIRARLKVENITERCRKARLRWFGHEKRRGQEYVGRKTL